MNTTERIKRQVVLASGSVSASTALHRLLSMAHDVTHDGEKTLFSVTLESVAGLISMSKLCVSVSATEQNSTLCKLRSTVDIREVGAPIEKVTNASDRIYHLIS